LFCFEEAGWNPASVSVKCTNEIEWFYKSKLRFWAKISDCGKLVDALWKDKFL
jgi:hypothetical protein